MPKIFRRDKSQDAAPHHNSALYATIRTMLANGNDYHYDGWDTAIRRVTQSALSPESLGLVLKCVVALGREHDSMHVGVQLIWAGAVSPSFCADRDTYFLIVTSEAGLPSSLHEFDRTVISPPAQPPGLKPAPN